MKISIFVSLIAGLQLISCCNGYYEINAKIPDPKEAARMARYVLNNVNWAVIGTNSTDSHVRGYPAANIAAISDGPVHKGHGLPYILMSHNITGKDIVKNQNISLSISLAENGYCQYNNLDPQDPRCARVVFLGIYKNISINDNNYLYAKKVLKERHPNLKSINDFYVGYLDIKFIAVLDWFGGAKIVNVTEYFNVKPEINMDILHTQKRNFAFNKKLQNEASIILNDFCGNDNIDATDNLVRFIIHKADWATITTHSYNIANVTNGTSFNSIVSISDGFSDSGSGIPYIYVSPLEYLVKHIEFDKRISMLISLASTKYCWNKDAVSDRCPRVILTGKFRKVDPNTTEYRFAQMALFSRHASMATLPENHQFFVAAIDIEYVQLPVKYCEKFLQPKNGFLDFLD